MSIKANENKLWSDFWTIAFLLVVKLSMVNYCITVDTNFYKFSLKNDCQSRFWYELRISKQDSDMN